MNHKKLERHGRKLFSLDSGVKIAGALGLKPSFVSRIKGGSAYLPSKYIPALVDLYGNKGIDENYLIKLTKDGGL